MKRILSCLILFLMLFSLYAKGQADEKFRLIHSDKLFITKAGEE